MLLTMHDASMTGIDRIAKMISTSDDAPGVVWESVSEEFKGHFADENHHSL